MPEYPEGRRIRVLCVDDLRDVTAVIRLLINHESDMECVGCLASANDLSEQVRNLKAEVVLLDATMPGKNPFEAMHELSRESPHVKTIIFSGFNDQAFITRAMDAGASGCVSKNDPTETIVQAVRTVAAGGTFFPSLPRAKSP